MCAPSNIEQNAAGNYGMPSSDFIKGHLPEGRVHDLWASQGIDEPNDLVWRSLDGNYQQ